jgi:hypothetical protein
MERQVEMLGRIESNISLIPAEGNGTPTFRQRKNSLRRPLSVKQPCDLKPAFLFTGLFVALMTTLLIVTTILPGSVPELNRFNSTIA